MVAACLAMLTVSSMALAQPAAEEQLNPRVSLVAMNEMPRNWRVVERRGLRVARAGVLVTGGGIATAALTGVPFFISAVGDGGERDNTSHTALGVAFGVGTAAVLAGPPLMAGGSLRARRALKEQGITVPAWPGVVSWVLYAGSAGLLFTESHTLDGVAALGSVLAMGGAIGFGAGQLSVVSPNRSGELVVSVAPVWIDHSPGLSIGTLF